MGQSLVKILVHLVFSTKYSQPIIMDDIRDELHAYISGILKAYDCKPLITNSEPDHAHVFFSLSKKYALSKVVEEIKRGSSIWIKTKGPKYELFYWQVGFGAFSVSQSDFGAVREHHLKISFQDELRALYELNGIEYDERYLWE